MINDIHGSKVERVEGSVYNIIEIEISDAPPKLKSESFQSKNNM